MTRMAGPDCAVMCNLIITHTHTHTHAINTRTPENNAIKTSPHLSVGDAQKI